MKQYFYRERITLFLSNGLFSIQITKISHKTTHTHTKPMKYFPVNKIYCWKSNDNYDFYGETHIIDRFLSFYFFYHARFRIFMCEPNDYRMPTVSSNEIGYPN